MMAGGLRTIAVALLLAVAGSAAMASCAVTVSLERVQLLHERLLTGTGGVSSATMQTLLDASLRTNEGQIASGLANTDLEPHLRQLGAYVTAIHQLSEEFLTGDSRTALTALRAPDIAGQNDVIGRLLTKFDCNTGRFRAATTATIDDADGDGPQASMAGILARSTTVRVGVGVLVLLGGSIAAFLYARHREAIRKQVIVGLAATVSDGATDTAIRVVNISRGGAKLKISPGFVPTKGQQLRISLGGASVMSRVAWANAHFCGLQFRETLSATRFRKVLKSDAVAGGAAALKGAARV